MAKGRRPLKAIKEQNAQLKNEYVTVAPLRNSEDICVSNQKRSEANMIAPRWTCREIQKWPPKTRLIFNSNCKLRSADTRRRY